MAVLFFTSANSITTPALPGPFSGINGAPTVGVGDGPFGINTIHCENNGDRVFLSNLAIPNTSTVSVGFGLTLPSTIRNPVQVCQLGTVAGFIWIVANPDGSISVNAQSSQLGGTFTAPSGTLQFGQRNYMEFFCPSWQSGHATCAIYVGGVQFASGSLSGYFGPLLDATLTQIWLGTVGDPMIFDSIYCCDGTGTINNSPLGPQVVGVIVPRASGTKSQWTPNGVGTDWEAVNNIPPDGDVNYISDNTLNDECSVELTTPSIFASITAVSVVVDARETTSAGRTIAPGVGNGTIQSYASSIPLTTVYAMNTAPFNSNPFTGVAWTLSDINTLQAAVKLTA